MRKLTMTLTATALLLGSMAVAAVAQTQVRGAAGLYAQLQNATPIEKAACRGFGPHCPPSFTWTCGYYGRCWCRPCR
jgi:uncharacterized protein YcfJ